MKYKVQLTDEAGNVFLYDISRSSCSEKTLNDFILEALQIPEDKLALCLQEFAVAVKASIALRKSFEAVVDKKFLKRIEIPAFTWIDDGEKKQSINLTVEEEK